MHMFLKRLMGIVLFAGYGMAVLFGLLWLDHHRETTLPRPTGPFAVGRTTDVWNDAGNLDPMAPQPGTQREIVAWIWYPTELRSIAQTVEYMPAPWRKAVEHHSGVLLTQFLTRDLSRVRVHSQQDAAVSPQQSKYPVVLMRAGLAALTTNYTTLAEDLASHGYVVVGFDAPYRSTVVVLPDGRVIERAPKNDADLVNGAAQEHLAEQLVQDWSADMGFALDQLERLDTSDPSSRFFGRLDLQRVGVFGHSLGGATTLAFCHQDARCKAGIDVDGAPLGNVIGEGMTQPFMFLLSDHRNESTAETGPVEANIRSIYDQLPTDRRMDIMIRGANHFGFSDDGAILKSPLLMRVLRMFGIVHLDGARQIEITAHCIQAFFDVYLKGAPASELHSMGGYPEIEYVH